LLGRREWTLLRRCVGYRQIRGIVDELKATQITVFAGSNPDDAGSGDGHSLDQPGDVANMKMSSALHNDHVYHPLPAKLAQKGSCVGGAPFLCVHDLKVGLFGLVFFALLPALLVLSTVAYIVADLSTYARAGFDGRNLRPSAASHRGRVLHTGPSRSPP
jgi:hypothetical protein